MSDARKNAVGESTVVVTHVVEVLDRTPALGGSWPARLVRSWLAIPFALAPTAPELFGFNVGPLQNGLLTALPGERKLPADLNNNTWREAILARLELPHLPH